jgi:hypothetical protein
MSRRSSLISFAIGAALADLVWLAARGPEEPFDSPPLESRFVLDANEAYEVTIGRLVECRAGQVWIEDAPTHLPPQWVLEASRRNRQVAVCFNRRSIGGGNDWRLGGLGPR